MTEHRMSPSEVIGFEEIDGGLYVCLEEESVPIFDRNGLKVIVKDPLIRKRLFGRGVNDHLGQKTHDDSFSVWRQGP